MKLIRTLGIIILVIVIASCSDQKVKPIMVESVVGEDLPDQEIYNSKVRITEFGELKAIVYFDTLRKYVEKKVTNLQNLKVEFYDEKGINSSTLTSKRGKIDNKTNDMYAIEDVVAVSDTGTTLLTDELMWRNKDKKIVTDKFVTILSGEDKTEGYGFESDQSLINYKIFHPVFRSKNKEGIK